MIGNGPLVPSSVYGGMNHPHLPPSSPDHNPNFSVLVKAAKPCSEAKLFNYRLPADSDYVRAEMQEMADQLEEERRLTGDASFVTLMKEMILVPGNRKRMIISIILMISQQMTGVNSVVSLIDAI